MSLGPVFTVMRMRPLPFGLRAGRMLPWMLAALVLAGCASRPINPPIACPNCTGCSLDVFPVLGSVTWTWPPRTTTINIPSNPGFIGVQFCAQDICTDTRRACVCLSNAIQVTIQ